MSQSTVWEVPEPLSEHDVQVDDETVVRVRRHGNPDGLRLVLSHGNGLAIDLYYPFWSLLAGEFDLMVYDLRNHGWNRVGSRTSHNLPTLANDHEVILESIDRRFGRKPTVGVFHSLAALVALISSSPRYAGLVLFDPPICRPPLGEEEFDAAAERLAAMTRRRGWRFESEAAYEELLLYSPSFVRVLPGVRALVAKTTLRKSPEGQDYQLRCPREYEAQISEYVRSVAPLVDLDGLRCPTKVIGADPTLPYSYLPTMDLTSLMAVDYDFVPETTHFLQLERPEECVAILSDFLGETGLLRHGARGIESDGAGPRQARNCAGSVP